MVSLIEYLILLIDLVHLFIWFIHYKLIKLRLFFLIYKLIKLINLTLWTKSSSLIWLVGLTLLVRTFIYFTQIKWPCSNDLINLTWFILVKGVLIIMKILCLNLLLCFGEVSFVIERCPKVIMHLRCFIK